MSREIKFRAWHIVKKVMFSAEEMGQDQLTLMPDGRGFVNVSSDSTHLSQIDNGQKMIPLQYTGLKDKNGKEIYEGDIIRYKSRSYGGFYDEDVIVIGEVTFGYSSWRVERRPATPDNRMTPDFEFCCDEEYIEVIGNIYDNPESLSPSIAKGQKGKEV